MKIRLDTNHGAIELTLDASSAPGTVENFAQYVRNEHYNNTVFHRVIKGFMIQGGGFAPGMDQKSTGSPIDNEADNGLTNVTGSVAMARTQDPHSASAQFFINTKDNDFLNHTAKTADGWGYCVFGQVTAGMDVVARIEESATGVHAGHRDVPVDDVVIRSAEIIDK